MTNVVLIIAQNDFQDKEFSDTKEALQKAGHKCDVASLTTEVATGAFGMQVNPDLDIEDVLVGLDMYSAVVFIGGGGAFELIDNDKIQGIAKLAFSKDMVVGAICIAPMILAKAGVLVGKRATVWDDNSEQSKYFSANDIEFSGEDVSVDGKMVTGNGPMAASAFGEKVASLL